MFIKKHWCARRDEYTKSKDGSDAGRMNQGASGQGKGHQ